uniref:Ubiquitin-activating enzyme E1 C-terminal domain-containing protein n=1 Tax=Oncorhynchus tshawytscha TaxID=74940 RepID=A0AAZ3RBE0_ONCTS
MNLSYTDSASRTSEFSPPEMSADSMEIDDSLYSRQRYVLGDSAMQQMAQSSVFLSGMGGLGVEIAKNIVLAGVKVLTLHDTKLCETWDLGSNFFLRQDDVLTQRNRALAVHPRVAELNPYVHVDTSSSSLDLSTDLCFLKRYQCVILTEARLSLQKKINDFCHFHQPPIRFIGCDAYGICVRVFCDFGDQFEVSDPTGEEAKEMFIQNITQGNPGVVTCMDSRTHGLQTGQSVLFREVNGMVTLNGTARQVTVLSPYSFAVGDTSCLQPYAHGGYFLLVKTPRTYSFAPLQIHAAMLALDAFQEQHNRLPNIGSLPLPLPLQAPVNSELVRCLSRTAQGSLPPLAAAVGGIASQEVLKALTGKFAPLQQWFYLDAIEVVKPLLSLSAEEFSPRGDRYDGLRACIGETMCLELHKLRVFMVTTPHYNNPCCHNPHCYNPHCYNPHCYNPHCYNPRSAVATLEINPEMQVDAHLNKVCPATEGVYNDLFYSRLHLVVTALDNVEARRYVDSRSVSNQKALLDSGTMGTKGHTEIIVPNLTESYNSHRDPPEEEIPFCTLKSFPAVIEHTIQWARDKFESAFAHKPTIYNMFWQTHSSAEAVLQRMQQRETLEGAFQVVKLLSRRPSQWEHCIILARLKFDKYFKRKVTLPPPPHTHTHTDSLFWQSPKRPPSPIEFDLKDSLQLEGTIDTLLTPDCVWTTERLRMSPRMFEKDDDLNGHMDFVASASSLRARMYSIEVADRLKTKRIAGKIIPAIATATAAVAGLVSLELVKVVGGYGFESFNNCFFNLAIPVMVLTEAAPVKRTQIREDISFSIWDRWTVWGHQHFSLSDFINAVLVNYGIEPTMVVHGVKMLYVPVMPGHNKRLKLTMQKLIKPSVDRRYVDLTVSFAPEYYFSPDGDAHTA